jgi:AraC-like DNA-binding protein
MSAVSLLLKSGHWEPNRLRILSPHYNSGVELVYIKRGHCDWIVEDRAWTVPPGSLFFTLPWQKHGGLHATESGVELFYVIVINYAKRPETLSFHPSLEIPDSESEELCRLMRSATQPFVQARPIIRTLLPRLHELRQAQDPDLRLQAAISRALLLETRHSILVPPTPVRPGFPRQVIRDFLAVLKEKCEEDWSLERMTESTGYGRTRLAELVGEITGDSPIRCLNRFRIDRACRLMTESERSITDIAHLCGFKDSAYFCRVFRSFRGQTPVQFRRSTK